MKGVRKSVNLVIDFLYSARLRLDILANSSLPVVIMRDEVYRNGLIDARKRGTKIRIITEVTPDNLGYSRDLAELCELCHLDGINANFGVSEFEYIAIGSLTLSQSISKLIYSNTKEMVEQQECVFESFWNRAVPAMTRIAEIEEGWGRPITKIIENPESSLALGAYLMQKAKEEVLVMLSTPDAFRRAIDMGRIDIYHAIVENGVKLRILVPDSTEVQQDVSKILGRVPTIAFSYLDKSLQTGTSLLIVDKKELIVWERNGDAKDDPLYAMGKATYSTSKSLVLSIYRICEILWKQIELYENIKIHNRMQSELVNIAAHEIRTPVQPILGMAELIETQFSDKDRVVITKEDMALILRNARRLERLTSDILEVTRIECGSINLNREIFDINEEIQNVARDAKDSIAEGVQLIIETGPEPLMVLADKSRIYEVVANLLSNSAKFTSMGRIVIRVEKKQDLGSSRQYVLVTVRDTGIGIDPEIMPRLFNKFASKSEHGTGLGLFIAKNIIEAHGGTIRGENNTNGSGGAIFSFTLQLIE
ncbi:MAG TPA: ATP-binding protein [Nitrososphaera sp.]|nr:ATP-binding protein [Nitrososphaera sp.]